MVFVLVTGSYYFVSNEVSPKASTSEAISILEMRRFADPHEKRVRRELVTGAYQERGCPGAVPRSKVFKLRWLRSFPLLCGGARSDIRSTDTTGPLPTLRSAAAPCLPVVRVSLPWKRKGVVSKGLNWTQ